MNTNKIFFKWIIPDFKQANASRKIVTSNSFLVSESRDCIGKLELQFTGKQAFGNDLVELRLHLSKFKKVSGNETFELYAKYSVLNASNQKTRTEGTLLKLITLKNPYRFGTLKQFQSTDEHLVGGNLVLLFELEERFSVQNFNQEVIDETFLNDKKLSDLILRIGSKSIYAVKGILALKSGYFNNMFTTNMPESAIAKIEIDVEYEVVIEMLRFMYTGKVKKLDILALKLFKAAYAYQIKDLPIICEKHLLKNITTENSTEILKVADSCHALSLKNNCLFFMSHNLQSIKKSRLSSDLSSHPHLLVEIIGILTAEK